MDHDALAPATTVVALGRQERVPGAGVNAPLELTSTYVADGAVNYARAGNPTWSAFEEVLGALEGGQALLFASGLAACDAALSLVPVGGVVVAPANAYNGVVVTLTERAAAGEIAVRWVDLTDLDAVREALDGATLLWVETPTNPLLEVADVPGLVGLARAVGALTVCDSTFATPLLQQPLSDGVDVVVHSATKYLSGHSDVVLGATVTADTDAGRALRERLHRHRTLRGAIPGPMEAWLAVRGIRTLALRFERACANAAELASRLDAHPAVARVRYPGSGAIVSIETGSADSAEALAGRTRLWLHATSLGGVESSLERRRRQPGEPETTPVDLVRLSVGIEDVEDLWRDLDEALTGASG